MRGGSRIVRIIERQGGQVVADKAYLWCGLERCLERDNLQPGAPITKRYFAQGVLDRGNASYYVTDHLGSVRQLVDAQGTIQARYDFDPYGNRTKLAGNADADMGFAGLFRHERSGLDLAVYRAYDPQRGRWLNRDPIKETGGLNLFEYANSNPLMLSDRTGLDPWGREQWTPARVYTDMGGGTTTYFDPMTRDLLVFPTRNAIARSSKPGAGDPYNGEFTYCEYPSSNEFGTAKWRTTDGRSRWIHGGGSSLGSHALDPQQGWVPTFGCTRAQNADVTTLCSKSEAWKKANPGQSIPYSRW